MKNIYLQKYIPKIYDCMDEEFVQFDNFWIKFEIETHNSLKVI